eukprot:366387-Chlamydomonas_euryale.AAC.2
MQQCSVAEGMQQCNDAEGMQQCSVAEGMRGEILVDISQDACWYRSSRYWLLSVKVLWASLKMLVDIAQDADWYLLRCLLVSHSMLVGVALDACWYQDSWWYLTRCLVICMQKERRQTSTDKGETPCHHA